MANLLLGTYTGQDPQGLEFRREGVCSGSVSPCDPQQGGKCGVLRVRQQLLCVVWSVRTFCLGEALARTLRCSPHTPLNMRCPLFALLPSDPGLGPE